MLFRNKTSDRSISPLKPFALKTKESLLVGLGVDPEKGSPCVHCVELWLKDRHVESQRIEVESLNTLAKNKLADLLTENTPHAFYEILNSGNATRLDSVVFPHIECSCKKSHYVAPNFISKNSNFAFSPVQQLRCMRYGTPTGNLWYFNAVGQSPFMYRVINAAGAHRDKHRARLSAIEAWIKKAVSNDLDLRLKSGDRVSAEDMQTGEREIIADPNIAQSPFGGIGIGTDKEQAILDALQSYSKYQVLQEYAATAKKPMLIVGTNSWLRERVPFFLLQQYDLYLLFYPNNTPNWVVGLAAFSRLSTKEKPIFLFSSSSNVLSALKSLIYQALEKCRPLDWANQKKAMPKEGEKRSTTTHLNLWWTNWIYRCPKISLKDVTHLEPYEQTMERWRMHLKETKTKASILSLNNETFPKQIRTIVKLWIPSLEDDLSDDSNVKGVGSWSNFQGSFLES